ncbi:MAG: hypothetical protein QOD86_2552 [Miltoncostaeaceae bacterium]|nr:hypothetical protein [Miltoncostaeaceae bacterium]
MLAWLVLSATAFGAVPAADLLPTTEAPATAAPTGAAPLEADLPALAPAVADEPEPEESAVLATPAVPPAPEDPAASTDPAPSDDATPTPSTGPSGPSALAAEDAPTPPGAIAPVLEDAVASLADGVVASVFGAPPAATEPPPSDLLGQVGGSVRGLITPIASAPAPEGPGIAPPGAAPTSPAGVPPVVGPVRAPATALPGPVASVHAMSGFFWGSPPPVTALPAPQATPVVGAPAGAGSLTRGGQVAAADGAAVLPGAGAGAPATSAPLVPLSQSPSDQVAPPAAITAAAGPAGAVAANSRPSGPPRGDPAGASPGGPPPAPPAPGPRPNDPTGLSGLPGSSGTSLFLGVAALCALIAFARPPRGMRRFVALPAPYVPAASTVGLERPG